MKYFVLYSNCDVASNRVVSLVHTAFNNVKEGLDHSCLELDLRNVDSCRTQIDTVLTRAWDFPGVLVISDEVWTEVLRVAPGPRVSDRSGYRHILAPHSKSTPIFCLKLNSNELNLNQLSEYIKWLVLEVDYYEHRKCQQDLAWAWDKEG